jgi:macrolide transport system ATP-binding/permease protein
MTRVCLLENFLQDLRFAVRQLWKAPGFTATSILTLAIGMCGSVAIFAFVDAALLKPLPYRDSARLIGVFESIAIFPQSNLSYLDYLDWKRLNKVFSSLEAYQRNDAILSTPEGPQQAYYGRVSDGFFRTLGVAPALGRDFYPGEDLPEAPRTLLLSYAAWQNRYGGRRDVLGQTVELDGTPNVIVGVLPADFHFAPAEPLEFWMPLHASNSCEKRRGCHNLYGVARLKDGISFGAALADVTLIAQQLEQQYPDSNRGQGAALATLTQVIAGDVRPVLLLLLSGVVLLLLIACLNIATLLLVRSENRRRETAVRGALGAPASRLLMQFVTEGFLLVLMGGGLGLACAGWAMQLLAKLVPANLMARMPYLHGLALNFHVLIFAGAVALLALILFSITPVIGASSSDIGAGIAEGSRGSSGSAWRRAGARLVIVELATAMVLLTGAGLLGKSFYLLLQVNIGLEPRHLTTLYVAAPMAHYKNDAQNFAFLKQVISSVESLPGVESVGLARQLPVTGNGNTIWFRVLGQPFHGEHNEVPTRQVSSAYFETVKAKLLDGRYFAETDDTSRPPVVIVNRAMQLKYFGGEGPVGKKIVYLSDNAKPMEIIGVINDIKEGQLDTPTPPVIYIPFNQEPRHDFFVFVRTAQAGHSLLPVLATTLNKIDSGIVTAGGATMDEKISDAPSTYLHRSSAWLVGSFAATALLLGVIGLYGMIAYSVSQRSREIGIRMALGAQRGTVYRLILKEAGRVTAIGAAAGLVCSVAGATLIRKMLFGTPPWDPLTLVSVTALLALSALLASVIPARRAASVNPIEALRSD